MATLRDMNKDVSRGLGDKLARFCAPLRDHLGVNHFYHYLLTDAGQYAAVGLHQGWHEWLYSSNQIELAAPYIYQNRDRLRGVVFCQTLPNKPWQSLVKEGIDQFSVHIGLQITKKTDKGMEGFGFGLKTGDPLQHMALLQELPLLNLFFHEYKKQFPDAILEDNLVDLPIIKPQKLEAPNLRSLVLGQMKVKVENPFSRRESEVIRELLKGNTTASGVADALFLSTRTAEGHLEHIKDKLGCFSKREMLQKLQELDSFGLF